MKKIKRNLMVGLLLLATIVLYSGCSPQITIKGDEENPIPINAEIKIHIYQHATSVVDDLQEGLEEEYEEEVAPQSSHFISRMVMHLASNFGVSSAYAAEVSLSPWDKAKAELKKAYRTAYPYLKKGYLGENRNGYVSVVDKAVKSNATDKKKAALAASKLNKARKAFYEIDAKQQKVSVQVIQANYAAAYREKAKGIWVEVCINKQWQWSKKLGDK